MNDSSDSSPPRVNDPLQWGYSLSNVHEILLPCLDAIGAKSVLEIGAFAGGGGLGIVNNGMNILNVSVDIQLIAKGLIIAVALAIAARA